MLQTMPEPSPPTTLHKVAEHEAPRAATLASPARSEYVTKLILKKPIFHVIFEFYGGKKEIIEQRKCLCCF